MNELKSALKRAFAVQIVIVVCFLVFSPFAEAGERQLALAECIQLALEHNLDVKIARYNPELAQYNVNLAYSRYEPSFNASMIRSFSSSPGGVDDENRPYPGTVTEQDSLRFGFGGFTPTGLSYD